MNGISFPRITESYLPGSILDQVKKNEDHKKRKIFQWIAIIILSNVMVVALMYTPPNSIPDLKEKKRADHPGFQKMILNINPLVPIDENEAELKISLLNSKNKIILPIGYLLEEIKNESNPSIRRFKIEIPKEEIFKVSAYQEQTLVAVSALEILKTTKIKKGSQYEVTF